MSLDLNKLASKADNIERTARKEKLECNEQELIRFYHNNIINHCLSKKEGLKDKPSPRVLSNWIEKGLVEVSASDKGKIKRFDKITSTWINILVELRGFGMSIPSLQKAKKHLFEFSHDDFNLIKFYFMKTVLIGSQTLVIYNDGTVRLLSTESYLKKVNRKKEGRLLPHINLCLEDFIEPEYTNYQRDFKSPVSSSFESTERIKLLYFLKTGDYQSMKIEIKEGDIRYIENFEMLMSNQDIVDSLSNWDFKEILVSIDDEVDTIIKSN